MADRDVVIITGSSGLIGSALVSRLGEEAGAAAVVVGLDRVPPRLAQPEAEYVPVDLASDESVSRAFARIRRAYGPRLASVIHLAAYYDFSGDDSPLYDELTVRGTGRLLGALEAFEVEQLVFSSTMLVHAPTRPGQPINEDSPIEAKWPYPRSKVEAVRLITGRRGGMRTVSLRIAGVYDDRCRSIPLAHQIARIYERRLTSQVFPGELEHGQAFVHLDDVVEAMALCVRRRRELPEQTALLIGEPETLSYGELQQRFGRLIHDEDWPTRRIPKPVAQAGAWLQDINPLDDPFIKPWMIGIADDHYELDISRARELLGWEPKHRLRDTLPKMVAALKADPAAWYREHKLELPRAAEKQAEEEPAPAGRVQA